MKLALFAAFGLAFATALSPFDADAKRLGGGKSTGMQREMPARTAPDAPAGKPAGPAQQGTPAQQAAPAAAPNAAGAQAAAPKRNWMGPLAGLAAGLGLAALMSHLGLGEAFGSFLLIALLAIAAIVVIRMIMNRRRQPQPAGMAYTASPAAGGQVAWPAPASAGTAAAESAPEPAPSAAEAPAVPAAVPVAKAFVPAAFDSEGFARTAKMIFIRLQAANDARDLDDLRAFTTPEMYAELSMDIRERGTEPQHTEVLAVESEVLDVADEGSRQVVSVRFRGQVQEQAGAAPVAVDEVWHLVKPADGSRSWAIAGIEQWQGTAAAH